MIIRAKSAWRIIRKADVRSLDRCFGMLEMESAAVRILERLKTADNFEATFSVDMFGSSIERNGFVELVFSGWLQHGTYNGSFSVKPSFLIRIATTICKRRK